MKTFQALVFKEGGPFLIKKATSFYSIKVCMGFTIAIAVRVPLFNSVVAHDYFALSPIVRLRTPPARRLCWPHLMMFSTIQKG